jgi:O-antigen/teichoic acid export membrane protein
MEHKTIFRNTIFQILARSSTTLVGLIVTILIARYFGAEGYGDYTKIISVVTLFYLVIDFGLNAAFIRDKKFVFSHLLYSRIGIAFLLYIFVNLGAYFLPFNSYSNTGFSEVVKFGILIFSLSFFTQAIIFSTAGLFQKKEKYQYFMISQALGALVNLFLIVLFVKLSFSIIFVVSSFVVAGIASSLVSLLFAREKPVFSIKIPKELFLVSLPLAAMLIFNLIYFKIDAIILSFYRPSEDVGIYGFSYKFFEFLIALPLFLSNSLYPKLVEKVNNRTRFLELIKKYRIIFLVFSLIALIISWGMSPILGIVNKDFVDAILPFRILILFLPFFFISSLYQWALITLKQQKFLMYIYLFNAVFNISLNLIFIPKYSYLASAVITGVSEGFIAILLIFQFSRIFSERKG